MTATTEENPHKEYIVRLNVEQMKLVAASVTMMRRLMHQDRRLHSAERFKVQRVGNEIEAALNNALKA